jgi:hypothetical protein
MRVGTRSLLLAPWLALLAAALALLITAPAIAQSPSPEPEEATGVTRELLGTTHPVGLSDARLELMRTTLEPGASMPPTRFDGSWLARMESGALTVSALEGSVWIEGFEGSEDEPIEGSRAVRLEAGQLLSFGPDAILVWENRGQERVSVLTTAVVDEDHDAMVVVEPVAGPERTARPEVVERFVLTGPGMTGDRYRITVADRSGRVTGARVPTEREVRFADSRSLWEPRDIGIGPLASLRSGAHELLIRWVGSICGPVVTVDVARDLSSITVIDRSPGCDLAPVGYWLVLRLRGPWFDPEDIEGSWVRRRP